VQAACAGDGRAIDALLSACQPDLKRFARRTCASTEDAEDAVQLALWQLYRQIGALRAVTRRGWIWLVLAGLIVAIGPVVRNDKAKFKFSLAAYSYRNLLSGKSQPLAGQILTNPEPSDSA